ncbi:uncharacterized protein LOC144636190 [Oculina patagonica]
MKFTTSQQILFAAVMTVFLAQVQSASFQRFRREVVEVTVKDYSQWELAELLCGQNGKAVSTDHVTFNTDFQCPKERTPYWNNLKYVFKADAALEKGGTPAYVFKCCYTAS